MPPLPVTNEDTGQVFLVARVAVMLMADELIAKVAATLAHAVVIEVLGALEDAGVAPKGTRQEYEKPLQSEGAPVPSSDQPNDPENKSGIPAEP